MDRELLTISEIATTLKIPESTVRYYRDRFPEFMPYIGEGRKRRYKKEVIEIIQVIAEGLRNNQTAEYIAERLRQKFSVSTEFQEDSQRSTAATQQQPNYEKALSIINKAFEERNNTIAEMKSMLEQLKEDKEKLQEEKSKLEEKNEKLFNEFMELNKKYVEAVNTKKGFWHRIFNK